jgi:hypothetical protein
LIKEIEDRTIFINEESKNLGNVLEKCLKWVDAGDRPPSFKVQRKWTPKKDTPRKARKHVTPVTPKIKKVVKNWSDNNERKLYYQVKTYFYKMRKLRIPILKTGDTYEF